MSVFSVFSSFMKDVRVRDLSITARDNKVIVVITTDSDDQALRLSKVLTDLYSKYRWLL